MESVFVLQDSFKLMDYVFWNVHRTVIIMVLENVFVKLATTMTMVYVKLESHVLHTVQETIEESVFVMQDIKCTMVTVQDVPMDKYGWLSKTDVLLLVV